MNIEVEMFPGHSTIFLTSQTVEINYFLYIETQTSYFLCYPLDIILGWFSPTCNVGKFTAFIEYSYVSIHDQNDSEMKNE